MPDTDTQQNSLAILLTGAASPNAAQTDPDSSLGGWPASTALTGLAIAVAGGPANITVTDASGNNGEGTAYVDAPTSDTLRYKAPGSSTYGASVTIANGETKVLVDGDDTDMYVIVSRDSATALSGTATLTLTDTLYNLFDDVSAAEATAGDDEYRCIAFRCDNVAGVTGLEFWIGSLGTEVDTDGAQLAASGADTITTTGDISDWPESGHAAILTSGGSVREIVYYSAVDVSAGDITVPAAGRGALGTSAAAGDSSDTIQPVPGIRIDAEPATAIGSVVFDGTGLDDCTSGGTATANIPREYVVEIDGTGTPDTFKWSHDGGSTWEATGVSITGAAQTLENGITVTFGATTGHTSGDAWTFSAGKGTTRADEDTEGSGLTWSTVYTQTAAIDDGSGALDEDEVCYLHIHREIVAGQAATPDWLGLINFAFEA